MPIPSPKAWTANESQKQHSHWLLRSTSRPRNGQQGLCPSRGGQGPRWPADGLFSAARQLLLRATRTLCDQGEFRAVLCHPKVTPGPWHPSPLPSCPGWGPRKTQVFLLEASCFLVLLDPCHTGPPNLDKPDHLTRTCCVSITFLVPGLLCPTQHPNAVQHPQCTGASGQADRPGFVLRGDGTECPLLLLASLNNWGSVWGLN